MILQVSLQPESSIRQPFRRAMAAVPLEGTPCFVRRTHRGAKAKAKEMASKEAKVMVRKEASVAAALRDIAYQPQDVADEAHRLRERRTSQYVDFTTMVAARKEASVTTFIRLFAPTLGTVANVMMPIVRSSTRRPRVHNRRPRALLRLRRKVVSSRRAKE